MVARRVEVTFTFRRLESLQYLSPPVRLQQLMDETARIAGMTEQDRQISEIVAEQRSRLRNFIRRRVPNPSDAEDIVQEVFYELLASVYELARGN
jgi:hypothetical protein